MNNFKQLKIGRGVQSPGLSISMLRCYEYDAVLNPTVRNRSVYLLYDKVKAILVDLILDVKILLC